LYNDKYYSFLLNKKKKLKKRKYNRKNGKGTDANEDDGNKKSREKDIDDNFINLELNHKISKKISKKDRENEDEKSDDDNNKKKKTKKYEDDLKNSEKNKEKTRLKKNIFDINNSNDVNISDSERVKIGKNISPFNKKNILYKKNHSQSEKKKGLYGNINDDNLSFSDSVDSNFKEKFSFFENNDFNRNKNKINGNNSKNIDEQYKDKKIINDGKNKNFENFDDKIKRRMHKHHHHHDHEQKNNNKINNNNHKILGEQITFLEQKIKNYEELIRTFQNKEENYRKERNDIDGQVSLLNKQLKEFKDNNEKLVSKLNQLSLEKSNTNKKPNNEKSFSGVNNENLKIKKKDVQNIVDDDDINHDYEFYYEDEYDKNGNIIGKIRKKRYFNINNSPPNHLNPSDSIPAQINDDIIKTEKSIYINSLNRKIQIAQKKYVLLLEDNGRYIYLLSFMYIFLDL
jgi:hypothetical protein